MVVCGSRTIHHHHNHHHIHDHVRDCERINLHDGIKSTTMLLITRMYTRVIHVILETKILAIENLLKIQGSPLELNRWKQVRVWRRIKHIYF